MGRKKKKRFVQKAPQAVYFKPRGIPMRDLEQQDVSVEEFEALRLVDSEGMQQQEAADMMGISRPTLSRILSAARTAVATALAHGRAILIGGGDYHCLATDGATKDMPQPPTSGGNEMPGFDGTGPNAGGGGRGGRCGRGQGTGRGRGMGQSQGMGQGQGTGRGQGRGMGRGQGMGQGMGGGKGGCVNPGAGQRQNQAATPAPATLTTQDIENMTKVAVTSEGPSLDDRVDPRFGRAAGFVIVDTETMESTYVDNGSSQTMAQGAGIQAAENVANAGAQVLLSGFVGPKAFSALSAAGLRIGQEVDGMTVREAVEKFKNGDVTMADAPNSQGGVAK